MKNKILVLALIAAVMTAGLVLVGCDAHPNCPGYSVFAGGIPSGKGECGSKLGSGGFMDCDNKCIQKRDNAKGDLSCNC
jgi:hypothetical protein